MEEVGERESNVHVYTSYDSLRRLGQTNLICCFSSAPASTSNTPLQLSLLPFASGTPPINAINNHVMSRETSLMASAHGHLNNEVMNNNRPPAPKFRKWLMRNNKSSLSGLTIVLMPQTSSMHRAGIMHGSSMFAFTSALYASNARTKKYKLN